MTYESIDDNVDQAQARMVKRFKDKTNIDKILKIRANRIQLIEDVINQMLINRAISNADGVQLDGIGEFFGEQGERSNRSDAEYRAFLFVLPAKLRQAGQHEVLLQAMKNLTGATLIEHEYFWPRAMAIYAVMDDVDSITNEEDVNTQMQAIRAQGVRLDVGFKPTQAFLFSSATDGGVPLNAGFSSLTDGSGAGKFIKLVGK